MLKEFHKTYVNKKNKEKFEIDAEVIKVQLNIFLRS